MLLTLGGGGIASDPLLALFPGVVNGGYWRASDPSNDNTTWRDLSGLGTHLTNNTNGGAIARYALGNALNGIQCYRNLIWSTGANFGFDLPGISINRRSHALWAVFRTRSNPSGGDRCVAKLGPNLTDCLYDNDGTIPTAVRVVGTDAQATALRNNSGLSCLIVNAGAANCGVRLNGVSQTLTALSVGSVSGGKLGGRGDGFQINGELYEYGLLDRVLTAPEIALIESTCASRYSRTLAPANQLPIIGDSLTEGLAAVANLGWANILDNNIGGTWLNRSYAASGTSAQSQAAFAAGYASLFSGSFTKNAAVLFIGTNDLGANSRTAAQLLGDLSTLTTAMSGAGFSIIMCTIVARDDGAWNGTKETHRLTANAGMAGLPGVTSVVDLAANAAFSNPSDTTYYQTDKLHLTDAANTVIESLVRPAVLAL